MANLPTILIVEDNPRHSRLIRDYLQHNGYDTIEVTNIKEALCEIQTSRGPLIVLIDIAIPEESGGMVLRRGGIQLEKELRQYNPNIPAIFVTVYGEAKDVIKTAQECERAIVSKPLDLAELLSQIKKVSPK